MNKISNKSDQYFQEKFLPLFHLVEKWILDGIVIGIERDDLVQSLLLHFVEDEDENSLKMLLSTTSHQYRQRMNVSSAKNNSNELDMLEIDTNRKYPNNNSMLLMRACEKNSFDMVRILILAGYRYGYSIVCYL